MRMWIRVSKPMRASILAIWGAFKDPDDIDLEVDPPPDLAIEIEITRSALDRIGIYGALRVPELWRFNGRTLECATPPGRWVLCGERDQRGISRAYP